MRNRTEIKPYRGTPYLGLWVNGKCVSLSKKRKHLEDQAEHWRNKE